MPLCPTCNGRYEEGATFCPKDGTPLLPDGEQGQQSLVGQVIGGRYRLTKLLGRGGMGEVYSGEHVHITKKVAVKLLHPEIGSNQEALIRFRQEAQSASSIGHDNIVIIDDFGQMDDGRVYLCMEFLQGESLNEAMQAPGGLDPVRALDVMLQVCDGLASAHAKGIIHRDMKPENCFRIRRGGNDDFIKITDAPRIRFDNSFTLEVWLKRAPQDGDYTILSKGEKNLFRAASDGDGLELCLRGYKVTKKTGRPAKGSRRRGAKK